MTKTPESYLQQHTPEDVQKRAGRNRQTLVVQKKQDGPEASGRRHDDWKAAHRSRMPHYEE